MDKEQGGGWGGGGKGSGEENASRFRLGTARRVSWKIQRLRPPLTRGD